MSTIKIPDGQKLTAEEFLSAWLNSHWNSNKKRPLYQWDYSITTKKIINVMDMYEAYIKTFE